MINLLSGRWEYFKNSDSEGMYSVFPAGKLNAPVIANIVIDGAYLSEAEGIMKLFAAVPELFSAVKFSIEVLRATRSYFSSNGLTLQDINQIIGTFDELIYRLESDEH